MSDCPCSNGDLTTVKCLEVFPLNERPPNFFLLGMWMRVRRDSRTPEFPVPDRLSCWSQLLPRENQCELFESWRGIMVE